jgi:DNA repair exonuclease SbcCD ATPase subunit
MRIKEFFIKRYGPLRDKGYALSDRFNLFFGRNEDGKTLKGVLPKVLDLTPSECRNIFVIRNSDLSIAGEGDFYMDLTDRLTGLRTEEISKIKEALREMGKVTPGGLIRDIKDEKLKTRLTKTETLLDDIERVAKNAKVEESDQLEEEAVLYSDRLGRTDRMIENLEAARKRQQYEKGREACENLKESLRNMEEMKIYNAKSEQTWRDCDRDIKRLEGDRKSREREIEYQKTELRAANEAYYQAHREFQILNETKNKIDNEIRQDLANYKAESERIALKTGQETILSSTWKVCIILFVVSIGGAILRPSSLFSFLALLFLASIIVVWVLKFRFARAKAALASDFERIKLSLSAYRKQEDDLRTIERMKETIEWKIKELRDEKIPEIVRKIRDSEDEINTIRTESREETLEGYKEKLRLKRELEKRIGEYRSVLRSHFGEIHEGLEENLSTWEKEIERLRGFCEAAKDTQYSEEAMSELKNQKQYLEEKMHDIHHRMGRFRKEMEEVERKVNEVLRLDGEYVYCRTLVDLDGARNRLRDFISAYEKDRDDVLKAIQIFDEIEREEKEKVSVLFDTESSISERFRQITGGLYEKVSLNPENGEIEVRRGDGLVLNAVKLSGGAYDQLYLSIRLALGEKLLKGQTGFFIMDDPFIKADPDRLRRQVEMLKVFSDLDWQIIYFSAKEEIRDILSKDIDRGIVKRIEIQRIWA